MGWSYSWLSWPLLSSPLSVSHLLVPTVKGLEETEHCSMSWLWAICSSSSMRMLSCLLLHLTNSFHSSFSWDIASSWKFLMTFWHIWMILLCVLLALYTFPSTTAASYTNCLIPCISFLDSCCLSRNFVVQSLAYGVTKKTII